MTISTLGWIVVGVAAWLAVALVVGVVIGRVIRRRDEQVPGDHARPSVARIPEPRFEPGDTAPLPRAVGRGRPRRR